MYYVLFNLNITVQVEKIVFVIQCLVKNTMIKLAYKMCVSDFIFCHYFSLQHIIKHWVSFSNIFENRMNNLYTFLFYLVLLLIMLLNMSLMFNCINKCERIYIVSSIQCYILYRIKYWLADYHQ